MSNKQTGIRENFFEKVREDLLKIKRGKGYDFPDSVIRETWSDNEVCQIFPISTPEICKKCDSIWFYPKNKFFQYSISKWPKDFIVIQHFMDKEYEFEIKDFEDFIDRIFGMKKKDENIFSISFNPDKITNENSYLCDECCDICYDYVNQYYFS
jgi:hypothetical protein